MKIQVLIDWLTKKILSISFCKGSKHDFNLLKNSETKISQNVMVVGDAGYVGMNKIYKNALIPIKCSKKKSLTKKDREHNKNVSRKRISIEHVFAILKTFRMFSGRYRKVDERFEIRFNLLCAFYNFEIK